MPLISQDVIPGIWRRQLLTFGIDDEGGLVASRGSWPVFEDSAIASAVRVEKQFQLLFGLPVYTVRVALVSFDTSSIVDGRDQVVMATLKLRPVLGPFGEAAIDNADGVSLANDAFGWGDAADASDFVTANQPGADGRAAFSSLVQDEDVDLRCRPSTVRRGATTQYRLTIIDNGAPTGRNRLFFALQGEDGEPRLEVQVQTNCHPPWDV